MSDLEYPACINELYQSEVLGEQAFLARFHEIVNAGPAEDQDILLSMIKHEEWFVHWIKKETAGEEGSLDAASSQLQYPLAAP